MFVMLVKQETEMLEGIVWVGEVFSMARRERGGLATNCVSCCNCAVRAAKVELMLLSETYCLSMSSCRWCCRYPKASATP